MNILCLHPVLSMRAIKVMASLHKQGHRIILAYEGIGSSAKADRKDFWAKTVQLPLGKTRLTFSLRRCAPFLLKDVLSKIVEEEKIDLIHVFSMPDHLAVAAIKYTDVPVIYDIRDLTTGMDHAAFLETRFGVLNKAQGWVRRRLEKKIERFACVNAEGVVCVTEDLEMKVVALYKLDHRKVIHLESYPLCEDLPVDISDSSHKLSRDGGVHLVYVGNLFPDGYENTVDFISEIADNKVHIHIYPSGRDDRVNACKERFGGDKFVHFYEPTKQSDLFKMLPRYDFGLVFYSPENCQLNRKLTISNKLLEYVACGLPVACTDLDAPRRFLERHNAGFVFRDPVELVTKAKELRGRFSFKRENFVMEKHVDKLLGLYDRVLNRLTA